MMPIKNREGETEANIFFTSYIVDQPENAPARPLTFSFNGGPGSASVWLHMGAIGPKRVKMNADGGMPSPPFALQARPRQREEGSTMQPWSSEETALSALPGVLH